MLRRLLRAAVPLIAVTIIALSTGTVWAIDQKAPWPSGNYNFDIDQKAPAHSGNYNFDYGSSDDKGTFGDSTKSNSRRPTVHFNGGSDRRTSLGGPSNVVPSGPGSH
jgi:hypothetical protein